MGVWADISESCELNSSWGKDGKKTVLSRKHREEQRLRDREKERCGRDLLQPGDRRRDKG